MEGGVHYALRSAYEHVKLTGFAAVKERLAGRIRFRSVFGDFEGAGEAAHFFYLMAAAPGLEASG